MLNHIFFKKKLFINKNQKVKIHTIHFSNSRKYTPFLVNLVDPSNLTIHKRLNNVEQLSIVTSTERNKTNKV